MKGPSTASNLARQTKVAHNPPLSRTTPARAVVPNIPPEATWFVSRRRDARDTVADVDASWTCVYESSFEASTAMTTCVRPWIPGPL